MALDWKITEPQEALIDWYDFETIVDINPDKEVLSVTIELINEEPYVAFFDDIFLKKNLINDKLLGAEKVYLLLEEATPLDEINRTVFGATENSRLISLAYAPESPIVGDDVNYSQLQIVNETTKEVLASKTFILETDAEERKVFTFGPVDTEKAEIDVYDTLTLVKKNFGTGMTLPRGLLILFWDIN